ncbi:MAG: hypothetical protein AAF367_18800 [Pseudomonadota bacterium]
MVFWIVTFLLSLAALVAAIARPGLSDLLLPALLPALISFGLLLRSIRRWRAQEEVVIDGSNIMYWKAGEPGIAAVRDVLARLAADRIKAGVMFDANAGYLLAGGYLDDKALARALGLPRDRVMVVPKGTQADPFILTAARDRGARVVTNDRFRDWAETFPEVRNKGFLIKGGYRDGALWLALDAQRVG